VAAAVLLALPRSEAIGITVGQIDDFQSGTTLQWQEGANSPNPPFVVPSGGPAGAGDAFLQNNSSGGFATGGRQVTFNTSQWSGDYLSAGVTRITADMANLGQTNLSMRIALGKGSFAKSATWYVSATPFDLPADGLWRQADFGIDTADLVCVNGACGTTSLSDVLADVTTVRLVAAAGGPAFKGDRIASQLGIDNIMARGGPEPLIGDLDTDGDIDFDDIGPFVVGLNDPQFYQEQFGMPPSVNGDTDGDGDFDFDDIPGFVTLLGGGQTGLASQSVPEPSTALLLSLAIFAMGLMAGCRRADRRFPC